MPSWVNKPARFLSTLAGFKTTWYIKSAANFEDQVGHPKLTMEAIELIRKLKNIMIGPVSNDSML